MRGLDSRRGTSASDPCRLLEVFGDGRDWFTVIAGNVVAGAARAVSDARTTGAVFKPVHGGA